MCALTNEENEWYIDIEFICSFEFSKKNAKRQKQDMLFANFCADVDSEFGMELINTEYVNFKNKEQAHIFISFDTDSLEEMEKNMGTITDFLEKYNLARFFIVYKD